MKVVCVKIPKGDPITLSFRSTGTRSGRWDFFTLGKTYIATYIAKKGPNFSSSPRPNTKDIFIIINDNNETAYFGDDDLDQYFKPLEDYREEKLNLILDI